ncbi:MAG TPA: hypothetical protein VM243_14725 [Phycisphaerae bacterium]|nr:hypothetical protein [Phycisphaerae bacterium]
MIVWLVFATYISAVITLSFVVVNWVDTMKIIDVRCRCGRHTARDCVILDDSDLTQIRENLSDLCPICRLQAPAIPTVPARRDKEAANPNRARQEAANPSDGPAEALS